MLSRREPCTGLRKKERRSPLKRSRHGIGIRARISSGLRGTGCTSTSMMPVRRRAAPDAPAWADSIVGFGAAFTSMLGSDLRMRHRSIGTASHSSVRFLAAEQRNQGALAPPRAVDRPARPPFTPANISPRSTRSRSATYRPPMSNPPAVILGGTLTALSVARSLTAAGIPVTVLDRRDSPVRVSRRRTRFVELDGRAMPDQMLAWLRSSPSGAVVLACADEGLELIARLRSELDDLCYIPMEANDDALYAMLDKRRTEEIAREHGIPAPRVLPLRVQADVERVIGEINFPCVLKPAHSH